MKRKLKETESSDEVESINKKSKNEEEIEEDTDSDEEEIEIDFDIKKFRKNLKAGNFFDDLKLFLKKAAKTPDIIFSYVGSGGKPLEIVEIIKSNEDSSIEVLSNLYEMLRMIIFFSANDENQRIESTVQALKYLVSKNKVSIEKLLSSAKSSDKVLILKILSIGVSLDREIGVEILKNITIFAKSNEKEKFTILQDNVKAKKYSYENSIRLAFVHFMMSFLLNETDTVLCKRILQKKFLFEFFLQGLHRDNYESIKNVLSCLSKNVLLASNSFSKPEKLKIFSDDAVKSLLKLYEWNEDEEEKKSVLNISHHFLVLLLANKKYGIAFKALTEKRQNQRQLQVIGLFKSVWMHEYPSKLVIEIVKACPDLMQNILDRLVMGLQPRITMQWFMCANFTKELLSTIEPSEMIHSLAGLEAKKISSNIIKLSISHYILQNVNENALINQDSLEIREISTNILHIMLDRCCKFINELKKNTNLKDFEQHRIKFDIINHIFTFFPNIDIILNSLYRSINLSVRKKSDDGEKLVKKQMKNTLEIMLLLIENFPATIEKIPTIIDYLEMLRPIYEYKLSSSDDVDTNEDLEIEMKVIKVILALQPSIISIETAMFNKVFIIMIQVYCCSSNDVYRKEAKDLLIKILQNSSLFPPNSSLEISIWLQSLKSVKRGILKEAAATFVSALRSIDPSNRDHRWNDEDDKCTQKLLENIDESNVENDGNSELSLTLPTLLSVSSSKLNRIVDFVEISMILFYHTYPDMKKSLLNLLKRDSLELNSKIVNYIKKKSLKNFNGILEDYSEFIYRELHNSIIDGKEIQINAKSEEEYQLLILQTIFCAIQLSNGDELDDEKIELLIKYIREFYEKVLNLESLNSTSNLSDTSKNFLQTKIVNKIFSSNFQLPSKFLIEQIFMRQNMLLDEFSIHGPLNQMTKFIEKLTNVFESNEEFESKSFNYRTKIISQLKEVENNTSNIDFLNIIDVFALNGNDCHEVVDIFIKKKGDAAHQILKLILKRIIKLKNFPLKSTQIKEIERIYVHFTKNTAIDLTEFEEILLNYFSTFPHNMMDLSTEIFKLAFRDELTVTRSFVRLISTLFHFKTEWNETFVKDVKNLKKEILYPLLHIAFEKKIINDDMLKPLYQDFKSGIIRTIEKPNKAAQIYRENIESSVKLIEMAMPLNECRDLAMKKFKFDATEIYQVKMLHAIFTKAKNLTEDSKEQIFINFINHWLQLFALAPAKLLKDYTNVLADWLSQAPSIEKLDEFQNENWEIFYKACLKNGLKTAEDSDLLVILAKAIRILHVNPTETTTIFDMIFTHSNFFNLAFNMKNSVKKWKRDLFFLLNVLVQKNPQIAHEKHVPIYLSSYQATMSSSDQLILNILRFYELRCEIDLFDYRPFLFGPTALAHFTSHDDQDLKLTKKTLDDMDNIYFKLMNSFEKSITDNTVNNYPLERFLAGVAMEDLDKFLTTNDEQHSNVYDPGYFLPLFEMIVSSSTFGFVSSAIRNNLMSLIPPALSCEDENMRLLAARILIKCRESTEGKKKTKEIWIRLYDAMQKGLADVREGTQDEDKNVKHFPRAASISTQLLAEIFNVLPNKLNNVNGVVSNYLIIKDKFEFATIPEHLVLFHSHDIHHEDHRLFLLNAIHNGIKSNLDFKLLNNTPLIKMLLSCFACPLSNRKIDTIILKIIDRLLTKTDKTQFLVQKYGLGLWIFQASVNVEAFEYDVIELIINLIEHVHCAMKNDSDTCKRLLASMFVLLEKFTRAKLSLSSFTKFLTVINEIKQFNYLNDEHSELILEMAKMFIPLENMQHLTYIKEYPNACKYLESKDEYAKTINLDISIKKLFLEVREFLIKFNAK